MEGDYWGMPDRRDNSPYIGAWWGGNFRGAREFPIKPKQGTSQIVYSPHDYGPSVYAQTWFEKDFTEKTLLDDYWYDTWAYIMLKISVLNSSVNGADTWTVRKIRSG